jgi:PLP dependent protein
MNNDLLVARWRALRDDLRALAQSPDREPVQLLAVSKYSGVEAIRILCAVGQYDFAESYLQSALQKIIALADLPITWHFIGHLQSNKCEAIAKNFSWVHSLTQIKHACLLAHARSAATPLQICLQINFSDDQKKHGLLPEAVPALIEVVLKQPALQLRGLMVLPKPGAVDDFKRLAELRDQLEKEFSISLPTLSMGMSADYRAAISAGATVVRIGSLLFQHT